MGRSRKVLGIGKVHLVAVMRLVDNVNANQRDGATDALPDTGDLAQQRDR